MTNVYYNSQDENKRTRFTSVIDFQMVSKRQSRFDIRTILFWFSVNDHSFKIIYDFKVFFSFIVRIQTASKLRPTRNIETILICLISMYRKGCATKKNTKFLPSLSVSAYHSLPFFQRGPELLEAICFQVVIQRGEMAAWNSGDGCAMASGRQILKTFSTLNELMNIGGDPLVYSRDWETRFLFSLLLETRFLIWNIVSVTAACQQRHHGFSGSPEIGA